MDKKECVTELQQLIADAQKLLDFLQQKKSPEYKDQAREMLKAFKKRLGDAYKTMDKVSATEKITETEENYFLPAVHKAYANLTITSGSTPNEKWAFELIDTQNTLTDYLDQLKDET